MGVGALQGRWGTLAQVVSGGCLVSCLQLGTLREGVQEGGGTHQGGGAQQVRTWGPPQEWGDPSQKGNGLSWPGQGVPSQEHPRTWTGPPRKGGSGGLELGDPHGQERGNLGGSEGQDMGVLTPHPKNGGSAWEDMGQHPEKGRPRGLSWAGCEGPSRTQRDPQENGGRAQLAWTLGDTLGGKRGAGEFSRSDHGGAHLSRTWRDISGWKGGLSWAGHGDPL